MSETGGRWPPSAFAPREGRAGNGWRHRHRAERAALRPIHQSTARAAPDYARTPDHQGREEAMERTSTGAGQGVEGRAGPRRRTAVVGSGVAGLTAAYILGRSRHVTLYEADDRLGGHAHTHELLSPHDGRVHRV